MAFRRRVVRRRAPVYRKRGTFRRRVIRRRRFPRRRYRNPNGNYVLHAKYSYIHTITEKQGSSVQFSPKPWDFVEFQKLTTLWEAFRFVRFNIQVRPLFNVTNPAQPVPNYAIAPYHAPLNLAVPFVDLQALNRCKTYNGCSPAYRSFVPSVLSCVRYLASNGAADWSGVETKWAPRLESIGSAPQTPHYAAVLAFDTNTTTGVAVPLSYQITLSAKFIMYNQKHLNTK